MGRSSDLGAHRTLLATARAAGFSRVLDASDAYDGLDPARLAVEPDDFHPNAEGHARLAHRLDGALAALPELGSLGVPTPGRSPLPVVSQHRFGGSVHRAVELAIPWAFLGAEPR